MNLTEHRRRLFQWLLHSHTLLGQNIQFDILYLRRLALPRLALDGSHLLIDLSVVNYLHNELRPEKSLKNLSPLLRTHIYSDFDADKSERYPDPASAIHYNAEDTWATTLGIAELARRTHSDFSPSTAKLSPFCLRFYSDTLWSCIRMAEAGVPINRNALLALEQLHLRRCDLAHSIMQSRFSCPLQGTGSNESKLAFMESCITFLDTHTQYEIRNHPLFELTEKTRRTAVNDLNRRLLSHHLHLFLSTEEPPPSTAAEANRLLLGLHLLGVHIHSQKLVSSYTFPLLRHRRSDERDRSSLLVPLCHTPPPKSPTASPTSFPVCTPSSMPSTSLPNSTNQSLLCSTDSKLPAGKSSRRQRSSKQWLLRHQLKKLRHGPHSNPLVKKARKKAAKPRLSTVTYSPPPSTVRTPWQHFPSVSPHISYPSWYVTPSAIKDTGGDEGGTVQGRLACKKFQHQTDPKPIKKCYRSRFPDGLIVSYDIDQHEMKTAGIISGDRSIVSAYDGTNPRDLHTERACQAFDTTYMLEVCGPPLTKKNPIFSDLFRQPGKHGNFGDLFKCGAAKFQRIMLHKGNQLLSLSACERIVNARYELRPQLIEWQDRLIHEVHRTGYLALPFTGQTRYFMEGGDFDENEIVNMPVQTQAANAVLRIQSYIHHHGPRLNDPAPPFLMFLQVHDSIWFDVRHPRFLPLLDSLFAEAVAYVTNREYWYWLCCHYGTFLPITYEKSTHAS